MRVGVPKEVKNHEYRVAITPIGVHELVEHGHEVFVERGAGIGSSIPDHEYEAAGAKLLDSADEVWGNLVRKYDLQPYKASELASWWHTDADLGRTVETFADMGKSRSLGFLDYQDSAQSFRDLFTELRAERIIPDVDGPAGADRQGADATAALETSDSPDAEVSA